MKNKVFLKITLMLLIVFVIIFLWANKDFFQYNYKFKYSEEITAEVYSVGGNFHPFLVPIGIRYNDNLYNIYMPKALGDIQGSPVKLHVIISPLEPDHPIFVRNLIIPYFLKYYIILALLQAFRLLWSIFCRRKS